MDESVNKNTLKAIILGAGRNEGKNLFRDMMPKCLMGDTFGSRVLDWILAAFSATNIENIVFVGGYRIGEIAERYRKLKYIYNHDWNRSGVLESLNKAKSEISSPLFVSYADIVFTPTVSEKIFSESSEWITIGIDSNWKTRFGVQDFEVRKNMVSLDGDYVTDIGFLPLRYNLDAEFIGLTYFGPKGITLLSDFFAHDYPSYFQKPFAQANGAENAFLTDLFRYFIEKGIPVKAVEIGAEWAEMDSPKQLSRFVLGTKAQTLERLSSVIKQGKFCKQLTFTVDEWISSKAVLIDNIQKEFSPQPIIIRSSAIIEDSWVLSCAGEFKSIINIDPTARDHIDNSVEQVILSYQKDGLKPNGENQILVQNMVQNVVMSGVAFTRDLVTGAPYYVINYDDVTEKTDTVTSGTYENLKTLTISRSCDAPIKTPHIARLLNVINEIEEATGSSALDIEFAVDANDDVYVLQTRPITCISDEDIINVSQGRREMERIREFLKLRFTRVPYLFGETTIFSDMSDWNPVEMIGANPRPLAVSLYHYLITNNVWRIARSKIGYNQPEPAVLMSCIGGHPYIDIRCSFNSFLPQKLSAGLSEKLVNYYLKRLNSNPELHDKIEFEVLFTCLDFDYENQTNQLLAEGFSKEETECLRRALYELTDNIVCGRVEPIANLNQRLKELNDRKNMLLDNHFNASGIPILIGQLLDDCIKNGTIPFTILARYAFIANSLLRSLVSRGVLTHEDRQDFLHSIETVATDLVKDLNAVKSGKMSRDNFLRQYGHLRPGTYDITSYRYDERPDFYFPLTNQEELSALHMNTGEKIFNLSSKSKTKIERLIKEEGFNFNVNQLFNFIRKAIIFREAGKFEFTKTISEILVLMERFGRKFGFSREDLSFINIEQLRNWGINHYPCDYTELIKAEIDYGRRWFFRGHRLKLPCLIGAPEHVDIIEQKLSKPNYVTLKKITGQMQLVEHDIDVSQLRGKVALIEGADPGFDWIFAHDIIGLITKYGGAASHMTIRAAEFAIPAAIGCGDYLFTRLQSATTVTIDCNAQTIHIL